jgi:hypothetical protein
MLSILVTLSQVPSTMALEASVDLVENPIQEGPFFREQHLGHAHTYSWLF